MAADLLVKWTVAALVAWVLTRRASPAQAHAARQVWLFVLAVPLLWGGSALFVTPAAYVQVRHDLLPAAMIDLRAWLSGVAPALYAVVAGALLIRTARGVWAVRRLLRASRRLPRCDEARLKDCIGSLELEIREADVDIPLTAGFFRSVILLPQNWRSLRADALSAILHHEAAHVRRRDCLVALIGSVLEAVFWFVPAVWLATGRLRWFAELAADADAARAMREGSYAAELLALADTWRRASRPILAITAGAETNVARRIRLLLDGGAVPARAWLLIAAAVLLAAAIPLSASLRFSRPGDWTTLPTHSIGGLHRHSHP